MIAKINRDACIGCGVCASVCPDVFEMDDDNIAFVKTNPIPAELEADVREAAKSCAVDAIEIEE